MLFSLYKTNHRIQLEHEEGGTISLSDMRNGTGGKNWRIWVQFTHHEQPNGQGGFRWEAMKVRGPQLQVDQYENEVRPHLVS